MTYSMFLETSASTLVFTTKFWKSELRSAAQCKFAVEFKNLQEYQSANNNTCIVSFLLCFLSCLPGFCQCFNIDVKHPRIFTGPEDALFGFSVLQHEMDGEKS